MQRSVAPSVSLSETHSSSKTIIFQVSFVIGHQPGWVCHKEIALHIAAAARQRLFTVLTLISRARCERR